MTTQTATVEVFLRAFKGLTKAQRHRFLEEVLRERAYREDLLEVATVEARRHESGRPLRKYLAERARRLRTLCVVGARLPIAS